MNPTPTVKQRRAVSPGEIAGILVGSSKAARDLRQDVALAAQTPVRVMIAGEHGVGKKRVAKLIHCHSAQSDAPFVRVRCDRLASTSDSHLFGRQHNAAGVIERAAGGTLFLENVDALSSTAQARLRQFLMAGGNVQAVGANDGARRAEVRIVCATSKPLAKQLASGAFCEELYYLLNTMYLPVPPLRERREDVGPLLDYFTAYYARRTGVAVPRLTQECRARCRDHSWPGNVRELQMVAALFASGTVSGAPAAVLDSAERMWGERFQGEA